MEKAKELEVRLKLSHLGSSVQKKNFSPPCVCVHFLSYRSDHISKEDKPGKCMMPQISYSLYTIALTQYVLAFLDLKQRESI